jgi:hypothetical protein
MKIILDFFRKRTYSFWILLVIFCVFLTNTLYVSYPDEFVNILGGVFINQGKIPYREFFDHHLPFAWYLASVFLRFSFGSFIIFRVFWALFQFGLLFFVGRYIKKSNKELHKFYLLYFFLYPFITVYYWTHLFIADSLAFLFFSLIFWLLIHETYSLKKNIRILWVISFLSFCFLFSSLTYVFLIGILYLWLFYLLIRKKFHWKETIKFVGICLVPYILYGVYLFLTNSWREFYISNFIYNTKLYISIPNYTKGHFFNPLKFVLTLIFNFYQNYIPVLVRIKEFDLYFPTVILLSFGSFLLLLIAAIENKVFFFFLFFILSLSAPRSNVFRIPETDYQSAVYIALGFSAAIIFFWRYSQTKLKQELLENFKKVSGLLLLFFFVFTSLFLIKNTYDKFYLRYTQKMPGIYDLSYTANILNQILEKDDYYWVGPYEPHETFFVKKGKLPGKYISLMPQFREDEYFKNTFIGQFEKNPPKIIIYKHEASIFGTPSTEFGKFFLDWVEKRYSSLKMMKNISVLQSPSSFKLQEDLYILNSEKEKYLGKLREFSYIK